MKTYVDYSLHCLHPKIKGIILRIVDYTVAEFKETTVTSTESFFINKYTKLC